MSSSDWIQIETDPKDIVLHVYRAMLELAPIEIPGQVKKARICALISTHSDVAAQTVETYIDLLYQLRPSKFKPSWKIILQNRWNAFRNCLFPNASE